MSKETREILISIDELESRVAVIENSKLMEIYISREERQVGSIYKGKVTNVLPGMQAAFIEIGLERNAFLCVDDVSARLGTEEVIDEIKEFSIKDMLKVNQESLVQIVKESIGGKGARVTTHLTLPGRYLVLLPAARYIGISRRIEEEEERDRLRLMVEKIKPRNMGVIVRTAAEGRDVDDLKKDLEFLTRLWDKIQTSAKRKKAPALIHQELTLVYKIVRDIFTSDIDRLIIDSAAEYDKVRELLDIISPSLKSRVHLYTDKKNLFEAHGIESEIEKALRRKVWLESGGYLVIDKTEALTVIDVNTGKFTGKKSLADTILKTNLESASEIARQIRLRDIGGIIVIDFIDMERNEDKNKVIHALNDAFKKDRTKTNFVGMSGLGLVEITRKRVSRDLDEYLRETCQYCGGRGRIFSLDTMKIKVEREIKKASLETKYEAILVEVNPRLALPLLEWEGEGLDKLEMETGKLIYLRVNKNLHIEKAEISSHTQKHIEKSITILLPGQEVDVTVEEVYGYNIQNGLGIYQGNVIEILQAGNMAGRNVRVVVTYVSRYYCQGQIKE